MSTYVAVFALVLSYAALVTAYLALRALARLRRSSRVLSRGVRGQPGRESLLEAGARQAELTASLRAELDELRGTVASLREQGPAEASTDADDGAGALRHVALVRYDAFDGAAGRLSFSLALLDDSGDGVALSALAGSVETRVYAKGVSGGHAAGEPPLSPEERQAVTAALGRRHIRRVAS